MEIIGIEKIPAELMRQRVSQRGLPGTGNTHDQKSCGLWHGLIVIVQFSEKAYSYFNAMTGIIVAARKAGYNPEIIPMIVEKISAKSGNQTGVYTATLGGAPPC